MLCFKLCFIEEVCQITVGVRIFKLVRQTKVNLGLKAIPSNLTYLCNDFCANSVVQIQLHRRLILDICKGDQPLLTKQQSGDISETSATTTTFVLILKLHRTYLSASLSFWLDPRTSVTGGAGFLESEKELRGFSGSNWLSAG